jgi:hypothetical protein
VVQAPAPARLIEGGLPTEALVAHVQVGKYADHQPLYRQSQIYARQGIELDRSTLADWVGRAAPKLRPVHERLFEHLKRSPRMFMDETRTAEAIRYALKLWSGLRFFLDDGRIEIDTNVVEPAIPPIALNRKNALFAGSDQGGVHWVVIASLIETCKLNAIDPQAYLADVLSRLVNRHPARQIDRLMP